METITYILAVIGIITLVLGFLISAARMLDKNETHRPTSESDLFKGGK